VTRSLLLAAAGFVVMEPVTALTHRLVMHGFGQRLHRSHHQPGTSRWQANDAYPLMFAAVVVLAMAAGFQVAGLAPLVPVCLGITAYGVAYGVVHDVYIHGRLRWFGGRRVAGLERLAVAHREHHRTSGAPYGMLVPVRSSSAGAPSGSRPSHVPVEP
jgi:beta-carotene 3-hydroxylase